MQGASPSLLAYSTTKNGLRGYVFMAYREIFTSKGRGFEFSYRPRNKPPVYERWYPKASWNLAKTDRERDKAHVLFLEAAKTGDKKPRKLLREAAAIEAAKIKTFKQFAEDVFIPIKVNGGLAPGTLTNYKTHLRLYIYPTIADRPLKEINSADIQKLLNDLSKRVSRQTQKPLSVGSRRWTYVTLHAIFDLAVDLEIIDHNPALKRFAPAQSKDAKIDDDSKFLDEKALNHLLSALKTEPVKWQTWVIIALSTGLRRGEICALQWSKINFETGLLYVDSQILVDEGKAHLSTPKSGKSRHCYLSDKAICLLKELRKEQAMQGYLSPFVFPLSTDLSAAMNPDSATRYLKRFGEKHEIKNLHPHLLRHTFASLAIAKGASVTGVSRVLGHSSAKVTLDIYAHGDDLLAKDASKKAQNAMFINDERNVI